MFVINFLPDSDLDDFSDAIREYMEIWKNDGEKIVQTWEDITGYTFKETFVNAIVYGNKGGQSHPLCLKAKGTLEEKKNHLVHEIGHRVLTLPRRLIFQKTKTQPDSLENHKILFLVLYDVYELLYGKNFADLAVEWDRAH